MPPDGLTPFSDLAYAMGRPRATGRLRVRPEDFMVEEDLGFEPEGEGGHVWLRVEKRGLNTADVALRLGRLAGVKPVAVGYAGLKDRHAATRQWFSVNLAGGGEPDWSAVAGDELALLRVTRGRRKLQRGALKGNRFAIVVRDLRGGGEALQARMERLAVEGVPNYFGEQRFGHDNLARARAMFAGGFKPRDKHRRGLYLSAARAALFNEVLSQRVTRGCWDRALAGEVLMLDGSHSIFAIDEVTADIEQRIRSHDIHPTGPLWGRGEPASRLTARDMEIEALNVCGLWQTGLETVGLKQQRRSLRLPARDVVWHFDADGHLEVRFWLPAGAYATAVLREIVVSL